MEFCGSRNVRNESVSLGLQERPTSRCPAQPCSSEVNFFFFVLSLDFLHEEHGILGILLVN
jgi:hypothetical protein